MTRQPTEACGRRVDGDPKDTSLIPITEGRHVERVVIMRGVGCPDPCYSPSPSVLLFRLRRPHVPPSLTPLFTRAYKSRWAVSMARLT